ncbi:flavin-containing monooxygenase [Allohahella sp. A8]|uniref:flavin-containing monooxygenase n=1 Tax=Allohahella sp. A8 TaxID=3141461 RepID=UPI003A7F739F
MHVDVAIIGAGQAGLAMAHVLQAASLDFQVLEAGIQAGGSWSKYYDSLSLFSPAQYSALPGMAFPGDPGRYPRRDEVVDYLAAYARRFDFPIRYDAPVSSVQREALGFNVIMRNGESMQAKAVVVATGAFSSPNRPNLTGLESFKGAVLHSSEYRRPADVRGSHVTVLGAGNSAVQIAYELSADHDVTLVARHPPVFMKQRPLGRDIHFWLRASGFDTAPLGAWFGWRLTEAVLDQGLYQQAFKDKKILYKPMFDRITTDGLQWGDSHQSVDSLIMATGFINKPRFLEGLDGLSAEEASRQRGGVSLAVPGLYFVGVPWQRSHASATLRGVGPDAAVVVRHLEKQRRLSRAVTSQRREPAL